MNNNQTLLKTPLHQLHQELGAKLVPFAGYEMPVQYPDGVLKEHLHTRVAAGLFDVSHMGQLLITGDDAANALESLMPMEIGKLPAWRQRYCLLTNETGGIIDDLMLTRRDDGFFLVVNAACKDNDIAHIESRIGNRCKMQLFENLALVALQGPKAVDVLAKLCGEATSLGFMTGAHLKIGDIPCFVTRSGYTGEDGFEISVAADQAEMLARLLLKDDLVEPIGLGARDSLRLEAGLCLYGHDIDTETTPVEAGLTWAIQKSRRGGGAKSGGFPGAATILAQIENPPSRKRVGIKALGRAPVRDGAELVDENERPIGTVSSGGFGPSVQGPVAMGYVEREFSQAGSRLRARVRNRLVDVEIHKLPFKAHGYVR